MAWVKSGIIAIEIKPEDNINVDTFEIYIEDVDSNKEGEIAKVPIADSLEDLILNLKIMWVWEIAILWQIMTLTKQHSLKPLILLHF